MFCRYGRRPTIYGFGILSSIFGFLLPFAKDFEVFLLVRFLGAVCNEAADLAAYVLCMEVTGSRWFTFDFANCYDSDCKKCGE